MASTKRLILSLDQNKFVLPQALIPEDTKAFMCEQFEDGRIVLSPLSASMEDLLLSDEAGKQHDVQTRFPNVIDFRESRIRLKNQQQKAGLASKTKQSEVLQTELAEKSAEDTRFVKLCHFSSRLEAEMLGEILKQAEIPYLIQSEDIGIFGPGAAPVPGGVRIAVRKADIHDAQRALAGLI
ncbi:hypothetical protein MNBD_NITROSPIRAE01-1870 [hydrothermal vent metagenome]|uniref:DUF2007 domain-containing protein n=1 Tax=hydrothermal vent metagenome TaxID=652676 RepID=A0A3B1D5G3_9ZZZZ